MSIAGLEVSAAGTQITLTWKVGSVLIDSSGAVLIDSNGNTLLNTDPFVGTQIQRSDNFAFTQNVVTTNQYTTNLNYIESGLAAKTYY